MMVSLRGGHTCLPSPGIVGPYQQRKAAFCCYGHRLGFYADKLYSDEGCLDECRGFGKSSEFIQIDVAQLS